MIITRTPFRISFVGGGSDLASFYKRSQGAVLSVAINKYMYISSHQYFEPNQIRVKYSKTETVSDLSQMEHPILRTVLEKFKVKGGLEISSIADVPSGTGMGSSSSFTVGLLHNLYAFQNKIVNKEILAQEACEVEIDLLKEPIGKQDQYAAAYGGMNIFRFYENDSVTTEQLHLSPSVLQSLEENLLMFYIGNQRKASDILKEQNINTATQKDKFAALEDMVKLVEELKKCLYSAHLTDFGKILHENWLLKKQLAGSISSTHIDDIYETAIKNGASGGKLLGAGGGGFMLFCCEKEKQPQLIKALSQLRKFDFSFDHEGSKLIYYGNYR
jgi:D-glycero-alpha-D-manno-heptose-7-phosphate kinase